jgi:hypothetical protein
MREDKQVESLPFLGRSWYRRGASYWIRRALITLAFLFVLAVLTAMTFGLVQGIATSNIPLWVRVLLLAIAAAAIVRSIFKAWSAFSIANRARKRGIALSMAEASGEPRRSARERQRRGIAGGAGLGALAMLGGGALLVVSVLFNFGWGVILVIASCQKYFSPEEFAAWQKIKRQEEQHPA